LIRRSKLDAISRFYDGRDRRDGSAFQHNFHNNLGHRVFNSSLFGLPFGGLGKPGRAKNKRPSVADLKFLIFD
jgi:hypothetical protein